MTTLQLNVGELILGLRLIDAHGKNGLALSELGHALKIQEKVRLTEDEVKAVGLTTAVTTPDGAEIPKDYSGPILQNTKWTDQKYEKTVELSDDQIKFFRTVIEKIDTEKKFTPEEGINAYTLAQKVLGLKAE